jgi:hypothetical protein
MISRSNPHTRPPLHAFYTMAALNATGLRTPSVAAQAERRSVAPVAALSAPAAAASSARCHNAALAPMVVRCELGLRARWPQVLT